MLIKLMMNSMHIFNIVYLWIILENKNSSILKLLSTVVILSTLMTIMEAIGLNFIVAYIIGIIIIIKIIYKYDFKESIFGLVLLMSINILLQLIINIIINKFVNNYIIERFIIELIITISIIIFSKVKSLNKYITLKYSTVQKTQNNVLTYFISTFSIYVLVFKLIWNYSNGIIQNNLFSIIAVFGGLILTQLFTYSYIAKVIKEKEKLKISNEYNSVINEIVKEIKQRQHDFANYKNTIKGIVNVVDKKEVKEAIDNYIKDEDIYDNKINELIYIDNVVIKSIIYTNMCKFKKYNINFEYKIENNVLDDILGYNEISNVLNNLLNNAFEEVIKDECVEKNIQIKIFNENKTSHLIIKNRAASPNNINLNEMFIRGYSTKNTGTRGYGLYNVQTIINSHKGNIKINVACEEIIFDIYFNNSLG